MDGRLTRATALTSDPLAGIRDGIRDGILRGIAHALSNRVAALSGVAGLVEFGDLSAQRLSKALGAEVAQLGALVDLLRLLAADVRQRGEAIELQAVLPQIVALHALHADLRDIACTVAHDRDAQPVHITRSALVQAVLILVDTAKRDVMASQGSVSLRYEGDPTWVTVAVERNRGAASSDGKDDVAPLRDRVGKLVALLDPALGVDVGMVDGPSSGVRLALRLPTLAEVSAARVALRGIRPVDALGA
jgi:nitrogen-specific signal transduction histidine kinase